MPAKSKCTGPGSPEEQQRDSVAKVVKLESLGLVKREAAQADRRVCEAVITAKGRELTNRIDKERDRILTALLAAWSPKDIAALAPLLRQLADRALAGES
jgi:DNA-binding MarR family transcriptional regulator